MRNWIYDAVSVVFVIVTIVFFYRTVEFLAQKDYLAGFITLAIGFLTLRTSAEFARFAVFSRGDSN